VFKRMVDLQLQAIIVAVRPAKTGLSLNFPHSVAENTKISD